MLTCLDCTLSAQQAHHGFTRGCGGCAARAVARGPHYRRVRDSGMQDRHYREALRQMDLTHDQVKAAAAADALPKGKR